MSSLSSKAAEMPWIGATHARKEQRICRSIALESSWCFVGCLSERNLSVIAFMMETRSRPFCLHHTLAFFSRSSLPRGEKYGPRPDAFCYSKIQSRGRHRLARVSHAPFAALFFVKKPSSQQQQTPATRQTCLSHSSIEIDKASKIELRIPFPLDKY